MRRFIGLRPFDQKLAFLFFGREEETQKIIKSVYLNQFTIVHSEPGLGKTSILKAGLIPNTQEINILPIYINLKSYVELTADNPTDFIINSIKKLTQNQTTYIDKLIEQKQSLWFHFKKLQALHPDKIFLLILDQFENFFTYPKLDQETFKKQLTSLLFDQIPVNLREQINNKLNSEPDLLTPEGYKLLYTNPKVHILISIRSDKLSELNYFSDKIPHIFSNIIKIPPLKPKTARYIIQKTANYSNPNINFDSPPFKFTEKALDIIINFLAGNYNFIEAFKIQILGQEIENIVIQNNITLITEKHLKNIEDLFINFYEKIIKQIPDEQQQIYARKFIEDELIFEQERRRLAIYEGIAKQRYHLTEQTLKILEKNNLIIRYKNIKGDKFIELAHDSLIDPLLIAKTKRLEYEIQREQWAKQKEILEQTTSALKKQMTKFKLALAAVIALLIALIISMLITINQKNLAQQNALLAQSNLLSAMALQKLDNDPTLSIRLAQKAYQTAPQNPTAIAATIKAFYHTNIFYQKPAYQNFDSSIFVSVSPHNAFFANVKLKNNHSLITVSTLYPKPLMPILFHKVNSIVNFVDFSPEENYIIYGAWDSSITILNLSNQNLKSKKLSGIVWTGKFISKTKIAVGLSNGQIIILDTNLNQINKIKAHNSDIKSIDISHNNLILTAAEDNTIKIWTPELKNISSIKIPQILKSQQLIISKAKFSINSKFIIAAINDYLHKYYVIKIWTINGKELFTLHPHNHWITDINVFDTTKIVSADATGKAAITDITTGKSNYLLGHSDKILAISSINQEEIITFSKDNTIRYWKVKPKIGSIFQKLNGNSNFLITADFIFIPKYNSIEIYDLLLRNKTTFKIKPLKIKYINQNTVIVISDSLIALFDGNHLITSHKFNFQPIDATIYNNQIIVSSPNEIFALSNNLQPLYKLDSAKLFTTNTDLFIISKNNLYQVQQNTIKFKLKIINYLEAKTYDDHLFILTPKNIYIANKKQVLRLPLNKQAKHFSVAQNFIITYQNNQINLIMLKDHKLLPILTFTLNGQILKAQINPSAQFILASYLPDNQYQPKIFHRIINPRRIIDYIDKIKYYGNLPTLTSDLASLAIYNDEFHQTDITH